LTEDQRDYLAQAQARLAAARLLLSQGFAEDAVSRAYYAMFYAAESLLEGEGLKFSSHAAVISAFGTAFREDRQGSRGVSSGADKGRGPAAAWGLLTL
jgi:uncharacterized protein (UPF0332 family)